MVTVDKANLASAIACATENYRTNTTGILIERDKTVSTNGHIMVLVELPEQEKLDELHPFMVQAQDCKQIEKLGNTKNRCLTVLGPNGHGKLQASPLQGKGTLTVDYQRVPEEVVFPEYSRVVESADKGDKVQFALNLDYLEMVRKVIKAAGGASAGGENFAIISVDKKEPNKHAVTIEGFSHGGKRVKAYIMPVTMPDK